MPERTRHNINIGQNPNILGLPFIWGIFNAASIFIFVLIAFFGGGFKVLIIPIIISIISYQYNKNKKISKVSKFINPNILLNSIIINSLYEDK